LIMISNVQLQYIVALDTYRHFVTASEKCFVTQPTLSMQVKKLEEQLGVIIFDRSKQPIVPTEVGTKIIGQARIALASNESIHAIIDEHNQTISGALTIGIIPSVAPYLVPRFIGSLTRNYPQISIKLVEMITDDIVASLQNETIDVGILSTPLAINNLHTSVLYFEEMLLYINKEHKLAKKKSITIDDLYSEDLRLLSKGHCFRSQVLNLCGATTGTEDAAFQYESGSLETLKKIVEVEGGYTLVPELSTLEDSNKAKVRSIPKLKPSREISLCYSRAYAKKRLLTVLEGEIKSSVPKKLHSSNGKQIVEWNQ